MKKLFSLILVLSLLFGVNSFANPNILNFKKDFAKLNLEQKSLFCLPVLDYGQVLMVLSLDPILKENLTNKAKEEYENKVMKTFSDLFIRHKYIMFYWIETLSDEIKIDLNKDNLFEMFKSEEVKNAIKKKKIDLIILKKSEEYLKQISLREFNKEKLLRGCLEELQPLFKSTKFNKAITLYNNTKNPEKLAEEANNKFLKLKKEISKKLN